MDGDAPQEEDGEHHLGGPRDAGGEVEIMENYSPPIYRDGKENDAGAGDEALGNGFRHGVEAAQQPPADVAGEERHEVGAVVQ